MIVLIFFVGGLIIGSFLNVLVYRLHAAQELFLSRSRCPKCESLIHWHDNIPVLSFILLKSRCRNCKEKISWQYPLVEFFTGVVFAVVGANFFSVSNPETWLTSGLYLAISSCLIVIFVYDLLYMEIPAAVLWTAVFLAAGLNLWLDFSHISSLGMLGSLGWNTLTGNLGALLAFLFFFVLVVAGKEKWMGMGDAYLAILLGLFLGWPKIILAVFLAFAIGAIFGIILLAAKKRKLKSAVPFAPFLILGTFIAWFFYGPIVGWYLGFFGI